MTRPAWIAAGTAALVIIIGASQTPRAQSGNVRLDIVVTDKDNKPITDLKQDELQIEDEGKKVEIKSFTPVSLETGRVAVILLDDSAPATATTPFQTLATHFLQATAPGDKVSIVRFHKAEDSIVFDAQTVMSRLGSFSAGQAPFSGASTPDEFLLLLAKIANGLTEPSNQRKAILCIGASSLCAMAERNKNALGDKFKIWTTMMNALGRANVSVYSFMPISTSVSDGSIIDATGGTGFTNAQNFMPFAQRVFAELGHHYIVEYAEPGPKDIHAIGVKTTRKGATLHVRKQR